MHRRAARGGVDQVDTRVPVLVDGGDQSVGGRVGTEAIVLSDDIPLGDLVALEVEFDNRAVLAQRAGLSHGPNAVLKPDKDVTTEVGHVVRTNHRTSGGADMVRQAHAGYELVL